MNYKSILARTIIVQTITFILFSGCKKEENKEFTDSAIIESYLQAGNYLTVRISRQIPFSSDVTYSSDDINNLSLEIEYNNSIHILEPLGGGKYIDSSIIVAEGATYNLNFEYNSKKVTAYTYVPVKPLNAALSTTVMVIEKVDLSSGMPSGPPTMPDPITLTWTNSDASNYLITVENLESTLEAIRDFGDKAPPGNIFKKSPTNSNTLEVHSMEFQYYGLHRIIIYHVLPDYATLYEANSTSSQNLANPSTSIVNGYGIFTGLNSDTVYVQVNEQ